VDAHWVVRRRGPHIFCTSGSQMAVTSALRARRPLPAGRFLELISVRGWVEPRTQGYSAAGRYFLSSLLLLPLWSMGLLSQFPNHFTDGRTPWPGDQLVARHRIKHRETNTRTHAHNQTFMPWVGFDPTILASERAKTLHALDRSATETGLEG
jgi:hypothetical protein